MGGDEMEDGKTGFSGVYTHTIVVVKSATIITGEKTVGL